MDSVSQSSAQRQTPGKIYSQLLAVVYKRLAEEWGVSVTWEDCLAYGRSVQDWPAFEDSAGALQYLKRYYQEPDDWNGYLSLLGMGEVLEAARRGRGIYND